MGYPKISIVTPSFNQAEFLEQTICSVLDQNYPNLEYVVIDGGSTDGSIDIIKKYADKFTYWVSEKDDGQYDAINKGFSRTSGDIMGWLNSSDVYYPWTFNIIAEIFENNKEIHWISGMPTNLSTGIAPQRVSYPKERNVYDVLSGNYKWIQQESIFWRRNLWDKAGGKLDTAVRFAGDLNLWLKFFQHACLYYVNTILAGFRYHDVRRGSAIPGGYHTEAEEVFKNFKSGLSSKIKLRTFITKVLIGNRKFLGRIFRKAKLCAWYQHHHIYYDFNAKKWLVRIR